MNKKGKKRMRRLMILFIMILLTLSILLVGTYAWFIGLRTVDVSEFSVTITGVDGLEISLDGENWKIEGEPLHINSSTIINTTSTTDDHAYSGHKNIWPSDGLVPLSTNGLMDATNSRLILYEKTGLPPSPGGYGIISNRLDNTGTDEADGYVAFDLFLKNGKGSSYNETYDPNADEDIYLTSNSYANSTPSGSSEEAYGIANSIRIGFFQIGRIKSSGYSPSISTGITCSGGEHITTTCTNSTNLDERRAKTWNIWEPNDSTHESNLVQLFNRICKKRSATGAYLETSCDTLTATSSNLTYAINQPITSTDQVDVYDGNNGYTSAKLTEMNTYKTNDAANYASDKKQLLKIAGNSVTKIRVYIWLEGQDVDNYDLIVNDANVAIKFGFTKDKYGISTT